MKSLILMLLLTLALFSENNLTDVNQSYNEVKKQIANNVTHTLMRTKSQNDSNVEVISKLGEFIGGVLETYSDHIANLLLSFSVGGSFVMFLISLFGYSKIKSISHDIKKNRKKIEKFQFQITKDFTKYKDGIKKEIKEEVLDQIVLLSDEVSKKVEKHAYKRINKNINTLTNEIQERRFSYQKIIYKVNQAKKLEYETILNSQISTDEKLEQISIVQAKYNEINNQDIPKLFSKKMKEVAIPSARKLSKIKEVSHIMKKELEKLLADEDYSFVDREDIREVLEDCYNWKEDKNKT